MRHQKTTAAVKSARVVFISVSTDRNRTADKPSEICAGYSHLFWKKADFKKM